MNKKDVGLFLKRHSPTMLSIAGSIGVVGTAILACCGTLKISKIEDPSASDRILAYIPTMICGGVTIGCILASDSLHRKARRALSSAYTAALLAGTGYENAISQTELPVSDCPEEKAFYDDFSGVWFAALTSDMLEIEGEVNSQLSEAGYVLLADVYDRMGIDADELPFDATRIGWQTGQENELWVSHFKFEFYPVQTDEVEGHIVSFETPPVPILD